MTSHLIALQVVIPLMAAPITAMLPKKYIAPWFATAIAWTTFIISLTLLLMVLEYGPMSYEMGGWQPPFGIEYRVDLLTAFILCLVTLIAAIAMPYGISSVASEVPEEKRGIFYALFLLCLTGLLGMVATNDAFNIYVFLEISSLATYALIAMGTNNKALLSSIEYLILGTVGATFFLIGVGLLYMSTGTLNISDLAQRLPNVESLKTVRAAFAFITVGLALKIALFPLHYWLTNAYAYAPSFATVFLAATATKVSIYIFLRFAFSVFGFNFSFVEMPVSIILMTLGVLAIITGSVTAIYQKGLRKMLAYSSVAQIGYIVLGIGLANHEGLTGGIVHLFNHGIAKAGLFMVSGSILLSVGGNYLEDIRGLGKLLPHTFTAYVVAGLSMIGVPLTAGFVTKWYLITGALNAGYWYIAVILLFSSLLAVIYIWKVVEAAYFQPRPEGAPIPKPVPILMQVTTWVLAGSCIFFGIFTEYSAGIAESISKYLLGL